MTDHEFGGHWTEDKLERVRKYLHAYTTIFTRNERARHFTTYFVDAFAGTGHRVEREPDEFQGSLPGFENTTPDEDAEAYRKGSARIALECEPPFDRYFFIERRSQHVEDLYDLAARYPGRRVRVEQGDANEYLKAWCQEVNWSNTRAVVFLDPYGMQVEWSTLEAIAATEAIDLWVLFPLGVAVNRLLKQDSLPPDDWSSKLTSTFGTDSWREAFYARVSEPTLFGNKELDRRTVRIQGIKKFFMKRLETIFAEVAPNPLELLNSHKNPIYLLCFAAGNPDKAKIAVKIARDILGR